MEKVNRNYKQPWNDVGVDLASTLSQIWCINPESTPAYKACYKVSEE